jgi:hypothetical protein
VLIDSEELEPILLAALDSPRVQSAVSRMVASDGANAIIEAFDSRLFDEFVDRMLASPALWRMIDEIAASPGRHRGDKPAESRLRRPDRRPGANALARR